MIKSKIKKKPCCGNGKAKGYGCGSMQLYRKYGLGRECGCYGEWLFSSEEGNKLIKKTTLKAKKVVKAKKKKEYKKEKQKVENWKNKLQTKVQEIARLIDYGQDCLARQIPGKQMHGGHILSKGGHSECRFNFHNIHRQSAYSNTYQNDDDLMKEGLEREYGKEYLDFVKSLKGREIPKWSNLEYHDFYKKACKIANAMRTDLKVNDAETRIELRNKANSTLSIYPKESSVFKNH